jgi:hypothetical protein
MKVFQSSNEIPGLTKEEVDSFLENKLNLQLPSTHEVGPISTQSGFTTIKIMKRKTFGSDQLFIFL